MYVFIFNDWIGLLLSLSVSTNAQASSGSPSVGGSGIDSDTGVTQMGICQIGVQSPCNGVK